MNEINKFLRFTLPGVTSVIVFLSMVALSDFSALQRAYGAIGKDSIIGVAIGIFLGSGAVGFVFANLYFALYWIYPFFEWFGLNHKKVLRELHNIIEVHHPDDGILDLKSINKRTAWRIACCIWWSQVEEDNNLKGVNIFCDRLINITHGIGATMVGLILAFCAWRCVHFHLLDSKNDILASLVLWVVIFLAFLFNYFRTLCAHEAIVNSSIKMLVDNRLEANERAKVFYIGRVNIKKMRNSKDKNKPDKPS